MKATSSISTCAQYATLKKYFSHPSLVIYFFHPLIKLKLGLQIGGRLLLANRSHIIFITVFFCGFAVPFTGKLCENTGPKPCCWDKPVIRFDVSSCNFNFKGHILSICGGTLTKHHGSKRMELKILVQYSDWRQTIIIADQCEIGHWSTTHNKTCKNLLQGLKIILGKVGPGLNLFIPWDSCSHREWSGGTCLVVIQSNLLFWSQYGSIVHRSLSHPRILDNPQTVSAYF
jgi:hypothetical protein